MPFGSSSSFALLFGALSMAALHALIPSHWLAFAVVGRAQRWSLRRALTVTLLAGLGHILMTILLGLILATVGKGVLRMIPPSAEHAATAGVLLVLGVYFAASSLWGHGHSHGAADSSDPDSVPASGLAGRIMAAPTVMGALVLGMTLSPCLDLLPIYAAAATLPWNMLAAISILMAVTTLTIMMTLVGLTMIGLERLHLHWLEHHEGVLVGGILIVLGVWLLRT